MVKLVVQNHVELHDLDFVSKDDRWDNYIKIMGPRLRNNNVLNRQRSSLAGGSCNLLRNNPIQSK